MSNVKKNKENVKALQLFKRFFYLGKIFKNIKRNKILHMDLDVKERILLKIERAEIMAAMISSRQNKD